MKLNLTKEQKEQFDEILEKLGESLEISKTEYDAAVVSYQAVGNQLSKEGSILAIYNPEIIPQGSFLLGTTIKPVNELDDIDIDLVCQLLGTLMQWTQKELKEKVGVQLIDNKTYEKLLEVPDGRRCWTLKYREDAQDSSQKYHMDILPAVVDSNFKKNIRAIYEARNIEAMDQLAIRITDKELTNYPTEKNHLFWLKSNPFGYALWFQDRALIAGKKAFLSEALVQEVPQYQKEKLPLQRVVQILKRHRDMMFSKPEDKEDKPISIIITTLAARAYNKETGILEALYNVVGKMESFIEDKWDEDKQKVIKWIGNPVNSDEENFADKWEDHPQRQINFYKWLKQVKLDIERTTAIQGLPAIQESLSKPFGAALVASTFKKYGDTMLKKREANKLKMAAKTGMLGNAGRTTIPFHQNYGNNE